MTTSFRAFALTLCWAALGCGTDVDRGTEPTLIGTTATFSVHCCTAPPSEANVTSDVLETIVGDGVEFPSLQNNATTRPIIPVDVDIAERSITLRYLEEFLAASGAFNGYVLEFAGGVGQITGAALASETTTPLGSVVVTVVENRALINVASLTGDENTVIVVDLEISAR